MTISPWTDHAASTSPDGRITATIENPVEIAMGAPTSGDLLLTTGLTVPGCNPSMVWSDDSRYLAVPQWLPDRRQCLLVIDTATNRLGYAPRPYRVLQLDSFTDGHIHGTDSPVHMPAPVSIALAEIEWDEP